MKESKKQVFEILEEVGFKNNHGWMFMLERLGFNEDDIKEIMDREDELSRVEWDSSFYKKQFSEWTEEEDNRIMRADIYRDKAKELKVDYKKIYDDSYKLDKLNVPFFVRKIIRKMRGVDKLEKQIKDYTMRYRINEYSKNKFANGVEPDLIVRAREYPIENFTESKKNYILCPYHDDSRPSMSIKNNFGYCFACGAYADAIELMMQINGIGFVEAVRKMQ